MRLVAFERDFLSFDVKQLAYGTISIAFKYNRIQIPSIFVYLFSAQILRGPGASTTWAPDLKDVRNDECKGFRLDIRQFLLGIDAVEGEVNVVEVSFHSM